MGKKYDQLDIDERYEIYRLHEAGRSRGEIGRLMGRSASTIGQKFGNNAVAGTTEYSATMVCDQAIDDLSASVQLADHRFLFGLHEPTEADHVGSQDCGEAALHFQYL